MIRHSYDVFRERVEYLVRKTVSVIPRKPMVAITLFPFFRDLGIDCVADTSSFGDPRVYRRLLRDMVARGAGAADVAGAAGTDGSAIHLIEGEEMMPNYWDLAADLVYPTDHGLISIGSAFARKIRELLQLG